MKRLPHDFVQNIVRYLSIALVFVTMVTVIGGFLVASNGNKRALDRATEEGVREDGNFSTFSEISESVLVNIEKLGIYITRQDYLEYEYNSLFALRIFKNRTEFNLPELHEGKLPKASNEISIDWLYAKNNDLNIGDTFTLYKKAFDIVGLIWVPDYTSPYRNNSDIIMDATHFGVALVSPSAFDTFPHEDITRNYAYRFDNRKLNKDERFDLSSDIRKRLTENGVLLNSFLTADENQAIAFVYNDFGNDVPMMKGFLFVMMTILAFIFSIIIDHTITSEAGTIGALTAMGMKRWELILHYLTLPFLVTLASAILGGTICMTLSYRFFNNMYHSAYSLPPLSDLFDLEALLFTTILPIVAMLVINIFLLFRRLSIMPIRFLRGEIKKNKSKKAVRLPDFSFLKRFRIRIILSNTSSYVMLFLGILFANFILTMGLVLKPTVDGYITKIEQESISNYQYILKAPANPSETTIGDAEKIFLRTIEYFDSGIKQSFEVSLFGISENSRYFPGINLTSDGLIVSESLWKKYKLHEEDVITLTDCATNKDYRITIRGFYPYVGGFSAFMPIDNMNKLVDNPDGYWNGWFSNEPLSITSDKIATVISPEILRGMGEQMMTTFLEMVNICLLAALVIYLVIFILLTKLVVDKNAHNISLMKILGYKDKELGDIFLFTTTAFVVFSLIVTLPPVTLGIDFMYRQLMFRKLSGYITIHTPWWIYVIMVTLGFTTYSVVNLLNVKRIKDLPMEQALKVAE